MFQKYLCCAKHLKHAILFSDVFLADICIIDVSKTYKSCVGERDKRQHTFEFWSELSFKKSFLQVLFVMGLYVGFPCKN